MIEYYFERMSDKALITMDTAFMMRPEILHEYVLVKRDLEK